MSESLQQQTASATRWSTLTELSVRLVLPIVNIILARLLTPDAFGVVATVTMIVSFAEIFADAGFQKYIIQHDFKDKGELDQVTCVAFWTNLFVSMFSWIIILIFREQLAALVGNPGLGFVIVVAALSIPLQAFSSIQMARFKRKMDFKTLFFIRIVATLVPLFITVPLAFATHSYWSLIIGTLVTNIVNAVALTIKSSWKIKLYYSWKQLKDMFAYSWWILMESISTWMTSYSDTFIVSIYLSSYFVGLYKTAMVTVNQIMGLIVAATSGPLFVALTRVKNDKESLSQTYNNYMQAVAVFVFPLSVGIWEYRTLLTTVLLGNQWLEASNFIGMWGLLSSIALVLGTYTNGLYNAVGKTFLSFLVSLLNIAVMIPLLVWSAPRGFEDLYVSRSLLRVVFVVIQLLTMKIALGYNIIVFLKQLVPPIVATLIMWGSSFLLKLVSPSITWQICTILISIVVYFTTYKALFKSTLTRSFTTLGIPIKVKFV